MERGSNSLITFFCAMPIVIHCLSSHSKISPEAALSLKQDLGDLAERAVLDDIHDALEHVPSLLGDLSELV